METLGIIGCGKMGQALMARIIPTQSTHIICCDINENILTAIKNQFGSRVQCTNDIEIVANQADVVILAVKPAQARQVLTQLACGCSKIILSMVAGIKRSALQAFAGPQTVVRIMPNTPALVGEGAMVMLDDGITPEVKKITNDIFSKAGYCHWITSEAQMDAVTGLSGSGPALFAILIEALADAAVAEGLPRTLALDLARETMLGTAKLLEKEHPAILKENVMSPGGTTAAGVLAAENSGFRHAAQSFVNAATEKSRNMG